MRLKLESLKSSKRLIKSWKNIPRDGSFKLTLKIRGSYLGSSIDGRSMLLSRNFINTVSESVIISVSMLPLTYNKLSPDGRENLWNSVLNSKDFRLQFLTNFPCAPLKKLQKHQTCFTKTNQSLTT